MSDLAPPPGSYTPQPPAPMPPQSPAARADGGTRQLITVLLAIVVIAFVALIIVLISAAGNAHTSSDQGQQVNNVFSNIDFRVVGLTPRSFLLTEELHRYVVDHSSPVDDVQQSLIAETAQLGDVARMQVSPEQGGLLTILTAAVGATSALEIGSFTGYSGLCIARGLAPGGKLLCCDVSEEWTSIARRHWQQAGVAERIELRLAPALDTLSSLPPDYAFDIAFIDADKQNYVPYAEAVIPRLRAGALLLVDNVLWSGRVADPTVDDADVRAIRDLNNRLARDQRLRTVLLPVADGLTIAQRIA